MAEGEEEWRTSAWTLFWRTKAGEAKGKGPDSPDSRLLRLVRQKMFFFKMKKPLRKFPALQ
jgi:hypothetical protein